MLRGWITFIQAAGWGLLIIGGSEGRVPGAILIGTSLIAAAIVETRK
jgi:hypothetical protein